jgi:hypothetical protein
MKKRAKTIIEISHRMSTPRAVRRIRKRSMWHRFH